MNNKFKIAIEINKILRMADTLNRTDLSEEQKSCLNVIIKSGVSVLTLNIGDNGNKELSEDISDTNETKGASILVADDSTTSQRLIASLLGREGHRVRLVDNGLKAIAALKEESFDLVIMDINMPLMDGIETTKTIREGKVPGVNKDLPVIAFTAYFDAAKDIEVYASVGINDYILKPLTAKEFFSVVNKYIKKDSNIPPSNNMQPLNNISTERRSSAVLNKKAEVSKAEGDITITILIAEDNDINLRLTESLLKKKGWRFISASNGEEALKAIAEHPEIDIILMDIQMPKMDGIDATDAIRVMEKSSNRHIPIIALTAHVMSEDRERYLHSGMDDYISKPINKDDFYHIIEKHIAILLSERDKDNLITSFKNVIYNVCCGDKELFVKLVEDFILSYDADMEELNSAISKKDYKKIETSAHKLKGVLGNLRFNNAYEFAFQLEKMAKASDLAEADTAFKKLSLSLSNIRKRCSDPSWNELIKGL